MKPMELADEESQADSSRDLNNIQEEMDGRL